MSKPEKKFKIGDIVTVSKYFETCPALPVCIFDEQNSAQKHLNQKVGQTAVWVTLPNPEGENFRRLRRLKNKQIAMVVVDILHRALTLHVVILYESQTFAISAGFLEPTEAV